MVDAGKYPLGAIYLFYIKKNTGFVTTFRGLTSGIWMMSSKT